MNKALSQAAQSRAALMLVLTTVLWGLSFPWMKELQDLAVDCPGGKPLASLTLIALRMPSGLLLLALWQRRLFTESTRREHAYGALIGVGFFSGFVLQLWGLAYTTPALSAFFTSLCSAWAPLIAWVVLRERIGALALVGLGVALCGTAVLVEGGWNLGPGEGLTFVSSLIYAVEILMLDRLGRRVRSQYLSAGFFVVNALLGVTAVLLLALVGPGLLGWLAWLSRYLSEPRVQLNLLGSILLSTILAFHWMNTYQPQLPASRAALIYLLEPVFGSFFSVCYGHDRLTGILVTGGILILAGNLLVELPLWRKPDREGE